MQLRAAPAQQVDATVCNVLQNINTQVQYRSNAASSKWNRRVKWIRNAQLVNNKDVVVSATCIGHYLRYICTSLKWLVHDCALLCIWAFRPSTEKQESSNKFQIKEVYRTWKLHYHDHHYKSLQTIVSIVYNNLPRYSLYRWLFWLWGSHELCNQRQCLWPETSQLYNGSGMNAY